MSILDSAKDMMNKAVATANELKNKKSAKPNKEAAVIQVKSSTDEGANAPAKEAIQKILELRDERQMSSKMLREKYVFSVMDTIGNLSRAVKENRYNEVIDILCDAYISLIGGYVNNQEEIELYLNKPGRAVVTTGEIYNYLQKLVAGISSIFDANGQRRKELLNRELEFSFIALSLYIAHEDKYEYDFYKCVKEKILELRSRPGHLNDENIWVYDDPEAAPSYRAKYYKCRNVNEEARADEQELLMHLTLAASKELKSEDRQQVREKTDQLMERYFTDRAYKENIDAELAKNRPAKNEDEEAPEQPVIETLKAFETDDEIEAKESEKK